MNKRYWNLLLFLAFILVLFVVVSFGEKYEDERENAIINEQSQRIADSVIKRAETLISEKKNATLTIALALAKDPDIVRAVDEKRYIQETLKSVSQDLNTHTEFKNVWISLVDAKGTNVARSWTPEHGNSLKNIRSDITNSDKIKTSVSVGKYDMTIKAMVPFFDKSNRFIGHIEVITHFNSIAKKIDSEGFETVVLADKRYKKQLTRPFTNLFIQDYYVANQDISQPLLKYMQDKGVPNIINHTKNYILFRKDGYLVAQKTLFDDNGRPMAYLLFFKKLDKVASELVSSEKYSTHLAMFLAIVITALVLLIFMEKGQESINAQYSFWRSLALFSLSFLSLAGIFAYFLNYYENSEKAQILKSYDRFIQRDYKLIENKYGAIAKAMFETVVNKPDVLELMHEAYGDKKDEARKDLYTMLFAEYQYFKTYEVRQFHFQLKNNESFLRFHRPELYGDDLTQFRPTVKWVNANNQAIEGFEEGKVYNGFRYVFPLNYMNGDKKTEHVGSVEISFSAHAFAKEFAFVHDAKAGLMIAKNIVEKNVRKEEQTNYEASIFEHFYYEKEIKQQMLYDNIHFDEKKLTQQERDSIETKIFQGDTFTIVSADNQTFFTFVPLKNALTHEVVGSIVLETHDDYLARQDQLLRLIMLGGILLIFLFTTFVFKQSRQKHLFKILSLKTQTVLDTQEAIVVITDGKNIFEVNKKFLDYFKYPSLEEFKKEYNCICDMFVEREGYFYTKIVPDGQTWIEYLNAMNQKDRVVLMKDEDGKEHSFAVSSSNYEKHFFIVTFYDISAKMEEHFILEDKVLHDKLTGAYNREFFEHNVEVLKEKNHKRGGYLGVVMFDIDHFKVVNDTYGHDVGDEILKELTAKIMGSIREDDYLVRWGGEEFVILLGVSSLEQASKMAENLRKMINNHSFKEVQNVTCSFGVTLAQPSQSIIQLMKNVDMALYESKQNGRNRVTTV